MNLYGPIKCPLSTNQLLSAANYFGHMIKFNLSTSASMWCMYVCEFVNKIASIEALYSFVFVHIFGHRQFQATVLR